MQTLPDTPKELLTVFMKTHEQRGFQVLRKETTTTLEDNTAEPSILSTCHGFRQGIVEEDRMTKLKLATEICSMFHPGDSEPARGCGEGGTRRSLRSLSTQTTPRSNKRTKKPATAACGPDQGAAAERGPSLLARCAACAGTRTPGPGYSARTRRRADYLAR